MNEAVERLLEAAREFVKVCRLVEAGVGVGSDEYDDARIRLESAILAVREAKRG